MNFRQRHGQMEAKRQYRIQRQARVEGAPVCGNGHGLIGGNIDARADRCLAPDCGSTEQHVSQPLPTFIDWAQVYQALQGDALVRPLTRAEVLCALTTVMRRNGVGRDTARTLLQDVTRIDPVMLSETTVDSLFRMWAPRNGVEPMTVEQALLATAYDDCDDDESAAA